jgi:hypothetical protein
LFGTYRILAAIQAPDPALPTYYEPAGIPKVTPFVSQKQPAQVHILQDADVEVMENLNPQVAIVRTQPLRLTRAELPLTFDVVSLSRGEAEEETTVAQTQVGEAEEDDDENDEEDNDGGEAE